MEYKSEFSKVLERKELDLFLRGEIPCNIEKSQYAPGQFKVDVGKVLSKIIYKFYYENKHIKEELENTFLKMLDNSDFDVYVVILYIMSQLFKEKNGLSPFEIQKEKIFFKLKGEVHNRKNRFIEGIYFPNDYEKKYVWNEIQRFNDICQQEYGLILMN